jgi:hypothetical protein
MAGGSKGRTVRAKTVTRVECWSHPASSSSLRGGLRRSASQSRARRNQASRSNSLAARSACLLASSAFSRYLSSVFMHKEYARRLRWFHLQMNYPANRRTAAGGGATMRGAGRTARCSVVSVVPSSSTIGSSNVSTRTQCNFALEGPKSSKVHN